jgi:hypothetical protein
VLTPMPQVEQNTPNELQGSQVIPQGVVHEPSLPPQVVACLGERLRAYYSQLVSLQFLSHCWWVLRPSQGEKLPLSKPRHEFFAVRMSRLVGAVAIPVGLDEPLLCSIIDPVVQEKEDRHV